MSQLINAHPSKYSKDNNYPIHQRIKRDYGYLEQHELTNNDNDDVAINADEDLPFIYSLIEHQRQNRKRLIDF